MSETTLIDVPLRADSDHPTHCHNFIRGSSTSYCGVPRGEQPEHGPMRAPGTGASVAPFCPTCGLPRCPICASRSAERGRAA